MESEKKNHAPHCLILPYPAQGHMNPMIQFSKRLIEKGVKITLITVTSFWKVISNKNLTSIDVESISDGYDEGGLLAAESLEDYKETFWKVGSQTLSELLHKLSSSENPPNCVIFDAFLPWVLDVGKSFGLVGVAFFTQSCSVNSVYYHTHEKLIELPLTQSEYLLPGLPNSIYELEPEVVDWLVKIWPLKTIGPSVPSMLLDKRLKDDKEYGVSLSDPNTEFCIKWLNDKPKGSVVCAFIW
uniref:UDP-glucosyltransferase family protein n=1 Tax=Medicago truncatula TaxID=3880 RepID=I3T9T8_MEDTR|nr:unknown [Medicago truncatula]